MGRVVLVTGVSSGFGSRFARRIAGDPGVDRVVGVDVAPPRADLGRVAFVRADIRNPVITKVVAGHDVDTVVHLSVRSTAGGGGRSSMKEHNVIGTMQLLAACQRSPSVERLVVRSSAAVYGSSSRDPAMFTEDMSARRALVGYAKDVLEVESYVRGFARRRPDVAVTMLRAANAVGPTVSTPLTGYFRMPVVPTVLGYDARLQFVHEDDLLAAVHHATASGVHGTFNLAGEGMLMLSQALRRLGRPSVAIPGRALAAASSVTRQPGLRRLQDEISGQLTYGRVVDIGRLRDQLGFRPSHTTASAFADFGRTVEPGRRRLLRLAAGHAVTSEADRG